MRVKWADKLELRCCCDMLCSGRSSRINFHCILLRGERMEVNVRSCVVVLFIEYRCT